MKRKLAFLITLLLVIAVMPISVSSDTTVSAAVTGINATRYSDDLIIYTSSRGTTTGTNVWGYEVVVTNGIVTSIGGNNSTIPTGDNSFVASGHGTMMTWLSANVTLGMESSFSESAMTVSFTYTDRSAMYALDAARSKALAARDTADTLCYVVHSGAASRLSAAESIYETVKASYDRGSGFSRTSASSLTDEYGVISDLYRDTQICDYRGVWIRPTQTTASEVDAYVQTCYDAGINMISVETMYNGTMIMPMPSDSGFEQNPDWAGFDMLQAYITSCHSRGMELHIWLPVFYSANTSSSNYSRTLAYKHPSWRSLTNNGSALYSDETSGMVFLSSANSEVVESLLTSYEYILTTYDIDGFQLDYIRYRDRTSADDYGYDPATIAAFKAAYPQYASYTVTYSTTAAYWDDFVSFRAQAVTDFVSKMRKLIDRVAPYVMLTADVGPDYQSAKTNLYQDSMTWLENGWLDMLHPMAYGDGYASKMGEFVSAAGDGCMVVPGLGIFMTEYDAEDMRRQTRDMLDVFCEGVVYFQIAQYLSKDCGTLLNSTIFTSRSICPSIDNGATAAACLDRVDARLALAVSNGSVGASVGNTLSSLCASARSACSVGSAGDAFSALNALNDALSNIGDTALRSVFASDLSNALYAAKRDMKNTSASLALADDTVFGDDATYLIFNPTASLPTAEALTGSLSGSSLTKNGASAARAATGSVLANSERSFTVVVRGDINGDGYVNGTDYLMVKRSVLGTYSLNPAQTLAGALTNGQSVTSTDYLKLKRAVLGTYSIG